MPETVNTDIYRTLGQGNDPLKQPLAIMQLLGAVNQNKLQNMDIAGKQGIADVYSKSPFPAAAEIGRAAGVHAPAAVAQSIENTTNKFGLDTAQTKYAQDTLAPLAAKKDLSSTDMAVWAANAARNGVNPSIISGILDNVYSAKTPNDKRKAILTHGIMSMGTAGLEGTSGAPDAEGRITDVPKAQAIFERAPGGTVTPRVTTNPPGFEEATKTGAIASASNMAAAQDKAQSYPAEMYAMRESLDALRRLGPKGVGPGTAEFNKLKSFIQSNAPSWLPGYDKFVGNPNDIADYDKLEKYLLNISTGIAGRFGHGTDQAAAMAVKGSPNVHISSLGADELLQATMGMRQMEQAMQLDAQRKGIKPDKFNSFAANWAKDQEPSAYMLPTMTDTQRSKLKERLAKDPKAMRNFQNSYQTAIDLGIIEPPTKQ